MTNSFDKWKLLRKYLTNTKNAFATISKLDVVIESKICRCENWKTTSNVEWLLDELIRQINELTRFIEKLVIRKIDWYRSKAIRDALRQWTTWYNVINWYEMRNDKKLNLLKSYEVRLYTRCRVDCIYYSTIIASLLNRLLNVKFVTLMQ